MNKPLGKTIRIFFVALLISLPAVSQQDFKTKINLSTPTPYLKEAVVLTVEIEQTNPKKVLFFEFSLPKHPFYEAIVLDRTLDNTLFHTKHRYRYILYPLQTGHIEIPLYLTLRQTDEDKVYFSASGDRDDFKGLETVDKRIDLPPIRLDVKPLPKGTLLVGDFTIQTHIDRNLTEAFEPVHIGLQIKGNGYPPQPPKLLPLQKGAHIFEGEPTIKRYMHKEKLFYDALYRYAIVAARSVSFPERTLSAFDPKSQRRYTLKIPAINLKIASPDQKAQSVRKLTDKENMPPLLHALQTRFIERLTQSAGYLASFISGWLLSSLWRRRKKPKKTSHRSHRVLEKLHTIEEPEALLRLLLAHPESSLEPILNDMLEAKRKNDTIALKEIKRRIGEALRSDDG